MDRDHRMKMTSTVRETEAGDTIDGGTERE